MHICFITHEYPKTGFPHGGVGSFVKTIAEALVKKGMQISIVGINYTDEYLETTELGVDIYRLKRSNVKGLAWYFNSEVINAKIKTIHEKKPIDIVETAELGLAFIHKMKGIKYVIRLHGGHHFFAEAENRAINWWKGYQEKRSFAKTDAFIAVSRYVKKHTEKYLDYKARPLKCIMYPITPVFFKSILPEKKSIPFQIVFAGTVCEKKGIRQLIQAFPIIRSKFPEATLEIYGRDWFYRDGTSYIEMLMEKEFPKLGDSISNINFHGAIKLEDLRNKYAQASVCVFPSHMETLGLVAPEAMAMGRPVVFTEKGPGAEVIENMKTGLLCDPHSPEDIAEKIIWFFEHESETKIIARNAKKHILETFDLDLLLNKNIKFYSGLLKQRSQ